MTRSAETATANERAQAWRAAFSALALCLAWIVFWYHDTAIGMVSIWIRSETFTHAFLVPPISFWLIWRQRHALATLVPSPCAPALVALALAGVGWLLGDLAAINALTQFMLVTMLVLAVPALFGRHVAGAMMFPLAYLFFAVPVGEFLTPTLMEWTADVTVRALTLTGIPVYREGQNFVIPSGSWSVVEACSGVRYLMASLTVGTLYAYLSYRSTKRRLLFVLVSILVPLVANWARAYMIVMLGHLSGNRLAVGVDHLIYGWLFFGVVIVVMFLIGARWSENPAAEECLKNGRTAQPAMAPGRAWLVAAALAVVTAVAPAWRWLIEGWESGRAMQPVVLSLNAPAGWASSNITGLSWRPDFVSPTAETAAEFEQAQYRVAVFVEFYRHQDYEHKLVSSGNVLARSGDTAWASANTGARPAIVGDQSISVRTAELRGADGQRFLVWRWYWVNGHLTSSDYVAKAWTAIARLKGQGDDSAAVIVVAPKNPPDGGEEALQAFVQAAGATLETTLQAAR